MQATPSLEVRMECLRARSGARFDPGLTEGSCPSCGAIVGSGTGQPTFTFGMRNTVRHGTGKEEF